MMENNHNEIILKIGQLQGRVDEGFKGINQRLDTVNGRLDKHDTAIKSLNETRSETKGTIKAISFMTHTAAAVAGTLLTLLASKYT